MLTWRAARWLLSTAEADDATDDDLSESMYARDMLEVAGDVAAATGLTQAAMEWHALADRITVEVVGPLHGAVGQDVPTERRAGRKSCLKCDGKFRSTGCANWVCVGCSSRRS
jgi:hypothetical protein